MDRGARVRVCVIAFWRLATGLPCWQSIALLCWMINISRGRRCGEIVPKGNTQREIWSICRRKRDMVTTTLQEERRSKKREKVNPRISQRKAVITGIFSCFLHIQHAHFLLYGEDRIHSINHLAPQKAKRNPSIRTPLVPKGSTRLHPFSNTRLSQNDPLSTT